MADPQGPLAISQIEHQQRTLLFTRFTNEDAYALGTSASELARAEELPITIDIRRHGQQLFLSARPGTSPDNAAWIERKVRLTDRTGKASLLVHLELARDDQTVGPANGLEPGLHAAVGGCFPISVRDVGMIGTMTVSGLPHQDDHDFVVRVIADFLTSREVR